MDGAASDLRPGLPWQMVEIHEPVRILFVIETTPEAMLRIMDAQSGDRPACAATTGCNWRRSTPSRPTIHLFRNGEFEPYEPRPTSCPTRASSVDWYRGWRDHLGFAVDRAPTPADRGRESHGGAAMNVRRICSRARRRASSPAPRCCWRVLGVAVAASAGR